MSFAPAALPARPAPGAACRGSASARRPAQEAPRGPLHGDARAEAGRRLPRRPGAGACRAALRRGRCRRAGARAREAAAHGGRPARARVDHAGHRPLAVDARDRREARPPAGGEERGRAPSSTRSPRGYGSAWSPSRTQPDVVHAPSQDHDAVRAVISAAGRRRGHRHRRRSADGGRHASRRTAEQGRRAPAAIVLLSDGKTTVGGDPVEVAETARPAEDPDLHGQPGNARRDGPESRLRAAARCGAGPGDPRADRGDIGRPCLLRARTTKSCPRSTRRSAPSSAPRKSIGRSHPVSPSPARSCSWAG